MKAAVKTQTTARIINGYNAAIMTGIVPYTPNDGIQKYKATFKLDAASEKARDEEILLCTKEGDSNLNVCNMIIAAFGGKELAEGQDPEPTLMKCINKPCALLCYPQTNKDGKVYSHTNSYGFYGDKPSVLPVSAVGQTIDIAEAPAKPAKKEPKSDDTNPFGGDGF